MTTFSLVSDLHLNYRDIELPGGQYLIMAGDIMEAGHLRRADHRNKNKDEAATYRRFINEELCKYERVIYVLGNHESYHNEYQDTRSRIQKEMPDNVTILESESMQIEDVHIFGGTFWTDMNRGDPESMFFLRNAMTDFKCIRHEHGTKLYSSTGAMYYSSHFAPQQAYAVHKQTLAQLDAFCAAHVDDKVLVVTHHTPTELSIAPNYKGQYHMNGGYHSRLSDFIMDRPCIKAWVSGHMHHSYQYYMGDTWLASNPRGYYGYEAIANKYAVKTFDLDNLPSKDQVAADYDWQEFTGQ